MIHRLRATLSLSGQVVGGFRMKGPPGECDSRTTHLNHMIEERNSYTGFFYLSTGGASSTPRKASMRRLALKLFSMRSARMKTCDSFGIFKGYLPWAFRRAETYRTFVSTDPYQRVNTLETVSA